HRLPVLERPPAVAEAALPLPDRVARRAEMPEYPARPPDVALRLEEGEGALAHLLRLAQLPHDDVRLREAALREGAHVVETGEVGEGNRLLAIGDRNLGASAGEAMKESRPAKPGRAAGRI